MCVASAEEISLVTGYEFEPLKSPFNTGLVPSATLLEDVKSSSDTTICKKTRDIGIPDRVTYNLPKSANSKWPKTSNGSPVKPGVGAKMQCKGGGFHKKNFKGKLFNRPRTANELFLSQNKKTVNLNEDKDGYNPTLVRTIGVVAPSNPTPNNQPTATNLQIKFKLQYRKYTQAVMEFQKKLIALKTLYDEVSTTRQEIVLITEKDPGEIPDWTNDNHLKAFTKSNANVREEMKILLEKIKSLGNENNSLDQNVQELVDKLKEKDEEIKRKNQIIDDLKSQKSALNASNDFEKLNKSICTIAYHVNAMKEKLSKDNRFFHGELKFGEEESIADQVIWTINTMENRHLADLDELKKLNALNKTIMEKCTELEQMIPDRPTILEDQEFKMNRFIEKLEDFCVMRGGYINVCTTKKVYSAEPVPQITNGPTSKECFDKKYQCRCIELEGQVNEMEATKQLMQSKMNLLYQKYKQYKTECNVMKKKLETIEKKGWMKKLIFF